MAGDGGDKTATLESGDGKNPLHVKVFHVILPFHRFTPQKIEGGPCQLIGHSSAFLLAILRDIFWIPLQECMKLIWVGSIMTPGEKDDS